jgi:hypothetical protein
MIQITPQIRILVAVEAIDGRKGIDAIAQLCREKLNADPFSGYLFIFRTRRGTAIRVLQFDGQGFWLATIESDPHLRTERSQSVRLSERVAAARRGVEAKPIGVDALELPRDIGAAGKARRRVISCFLHGRKGSTAARQNGSRGMPINGTFQKAKSDRALASDACGRKCFVQECPRVRPMIGRP